MVQALLDSIRQHIPLTPADEDVISKSFNCRNLASKEILLSEGYPCRHLFFVASGLLRAYSHNDNGKEITVMFAKQGWWITDMNSFVNHSQAEVTIQALRESKVLSIDQFKLDELYKVLPGFNELWRILFQNAYCREQNRVVQMLTMPAATRYQQFVKNYPQIFSSITQRQLASYLGVTPEFLSTIKAGLNLP